MPNNQQGRGLRSALCGLACAMPWVLMAQQADGTLVDLIRSVKAQKEAALDPGRAARQQAVQAGQSLAQSTPMLWSITGINDDYTALLLLDGQVQQVHSGDLPVGLGAWRVLSVDSTGVLLSRAGRRLHLPAPDAGTRPEPYMGQLGAAAGLSGGTAQAPLTLELAQRLPGAVPAQPAVAPAVLTPAQVRASSLQAPASSAAERR